MRKRFARSNAFRPSRLWAGIQGQWLHAATTTTSAVVLVGMQAPTSLQALTSDPVEDMTILRIVGDFSVGIGANAGLWVLALTVQDQTWTPSATFGLDADKRMLWSMHYQGVATTLPTPTWLPPGVLLTGNATTVAVAAPREAVHIDIAPRVRIEAGKALYLVAYEEAGTAEFTTASSNMRLLVQRSGRRSR